MREQHRIQTRQPARPQIRRHHILAAGEKIHFGTLTLDVLSSGHERTENVNDESLVLRAAYQGSTMLFLGDAERVLERGIAAHATPADVLKVAHHGSATSTTSELLAATKPKFAVISVGVNNPYGHPRADVLARLRAASVLTYRTDVNGATSFYLTGSTVSAEDYLQTPPMLPERPRPRPAGSRDTQR
jgi:competence protein ComEC